nr:HD domain-containing protein [Desulfobacteraceae bacterium]
IAMLFKSAPLHDIGKVGIPDHILLKPGRLEPHEFTIMKGHAALGRAVIERAERTLGMDVKFLSCAKEITQSHHEKWDGSGYPDGIIGKDIPLSARLMAVADVYDALISRRVYKDAVPHDKAVETITAGKGSHFDPDIIDAFFAIRDEFRSIAARYTDPDANIR